MVVTEVTEVTGDLVVTEVTTEVTGDLVVTEVTEVATWW